MNRRRFVLWSGAAVGWPLSVLSQDKVRRIGWLEPGTPASFPERRAAFLEVLRNAGYSEGKNLSVDFRFAGGKIEAFPALAAEMVRQKPECVLAVGVDAIRALRRASSSVPIVMGTIDADPVAEGFAASLARPGGNVTGLTGISWELAGKRLELLREVAPKVKRVAVVYDPRSPAGQAHIKKAEEAARTLKMDLLVVGVKAADELDRAFSGLNGAGADALLVVGIGLVTAHRSRVAALAVSSRLPAIFSYVEFVPDGGLMAYAPSVVEQFRRAATYVDKILRGANPADLPIEQSRIFELAVNLKTAKQIGVQIPRSILARADRVIE